VTGTCPLFVCSPVDEKYMTVSNLMWQYCRWHFSLEFPVDKNKNNMGTPKIVT